MNTTSIEKELANLNEIDFGIQIFEKGSVEVITLPNGSEIHIQH